MRIVNRNMAGRLLSAALALMFVFSFASAFCAEEQTDYFDLSAISRTPAGAYGSLSVSDEGNLEFVSNNDRSDVRFFGVTYDLAQGIPDQSQAQAMAQTLHSRGFNLIRVENVYAALGSGNALNEAAMADFDVFANEMYENGVYLYLEMFSPESLGTSGAGMYISTTAVSTAQRFLRNFFTHENARGVIYANDNSIAVVQYSTDACVLLEPDGDVSEYSSTLTDRFNTWLATRYDDSDTALGTAWTDRYLDSALRDGESLSAGNIAPGSVMSGDTETPVDWQSVSGRDMDFRLFMIEQQLSVVSTVQSTLSELGYSGLFITNGTSSGPATARLAGSADASVKTLVYDSSMSLSDALGVLAGGVISGKPFFMHWDTEASDVNKSEALISLSVYASFQDWDAVILGSYEDVTSDPELWNEISFAASIYRNGRVSPAITSADVVYTESDMLCESGAFGVINGQLALFSKVGNVFVEDTYAGDADIAVSSGNTASGDYTGANAAILYSSSSFLDQYESEADKSLWYNTQVEAKIMTETEVNDLSVYVGEKRAIVTDGVVADLDTLGQIISMLPAYDGGVYDDGVVTCDNEQVIYDSQTDSVTVDGSMLIYMSDFAGDNQFEGFTVGTSGECSLIVISIDSAASYLSVSSNILVSAFGADGAAPAVTLDISRTSVDAYAYGVTSDGARADSVQAAEDTGNGLWSMQLDGYGKYEILFVEREVDDNLDNYVIEINSRPNLLLVIAIPALAFIALAVVFVWYSNKRKLKREEALRKETLEIKRRENAERLKKTYRPFDDE